MIGRITLGLFLGGIVVAAGGLVAWLVVMLRGHDPKWSKRLTLTAASIAIAALFLNSLS
ncbi:hypothetical protein [Lacticaseibacillus salsurivasis]|uniref:hypothetical protein n=1 Tax=Lacticaseibacillus salsurivasis TaxID=3081441 RepID=UPI0030C74BA8